MALLNVGGYVLAGGKSSRMGRDKALLELAGKPLIAHAVTKMRRVCSEVHVVSGRPELASFAPLIRDLHEGCGPLGGLETAMESSRHKWNLFLPVDVPFLPTALLENWIRRVAGEQGRTARVAMFTVCGVPQPLLCLLHKEVTPFVRAAMARQEYKVFPVLKGAAEELARRRGVGLEQVFVNTLWDEDGEDRELVIEAGGGEPWQGVTKPQRLAKGLWFANLNTPEEFADGERHVDTLDT